MQLFVMKYEKGDFSSKDATNYSIYLKDNEGREQTISIYCSHSLRATWNIDNDDSLFQSLYPLIRVEIVSLLTKGISLNINEIYPLEFTTYNSPSKPPSQRYQLPDTINIIRNAEASRAPVTYAVFISHVNSDRQLGIALKELLKDFNVKSFVAHEDIEYGQVWEPTIIETIRNAKVTVILGSEGVEDSPWVNFELGLSYEKMFPIIFNKLSDRVSYIKSKQGIIVNYEDIDNTILKLVLSILSKLGLETEKTPDEIKALSSFTKMKKIISEHPKKAISRYTPESRIEYKPSVAESHLSLLRGVGNRFVKNREESKKYNSERNALIKSEIVNDKYFFMTATPIPLEEDRTDTSDSAIQDIFFKPSYSRHGGWNMYFTDVRSNVKPIFEGLEKKSGNWALKLFRNGYLEFRASVDISFCWGQDEEEYKIKPQFNPRAVIEFPVSFIKLANELATKKKVLKSYVITMAYINCGEYRLLPYSPNSISYRVGHEEGKAILNNWYCDIIAESMDDANDKIAFKLIERIYNTFGHSKEKIPFFDDKTVFSIKE
jgi:hypothetical protein